MALSSSATDVWTEFNIDKTIVIKDFEKNVFGEYDFVDETDYSITRKKDRIPIPNTDGVGMMLPNAFGAVQVNKMIRLPFIKGLLGVFDFKKFIEYNKCSPVIEDIYGVKHDIIAEDIQVIFTESQFKLHKYYDSYEQYKEYFKKYNCTAGYAKPEESDIGNAKINYQMLQSLVEITDEEIDTLVQPSIDSLKTICNSVENICELFGATKENKNKTALQEAVYLYPELINDRFFKEQIREIKNSLVKKYKSGKLKVKGKYTFILPDLYAACEYWFMRIEEPQGLIHDGEVFCRLFKDEKDSKLDCLRSPHLFCEHGIRENVANNSYGERQAELGKWFTTNALYVSCDDLISKLLQFDVDGDTSLVVADKVIIAAAERTIKKYDIVPLYYNMGKAKPVILDNYEIYKGLITAFTGGNIGMYSNSISKIWNDDVFVREENSEQYNALDHIKRLCCQNNQVIDYAKTLYKTDFPKQIGREIKEYTNQKLPHFFKYAKDKKDNQIENKNNSFINRLDDLIKNPRMRFVYADEASKRMILKKNDKSIRLSSPDFRMLLSDKDMYYEDVFTDQRIIDTYAEYSHKYSYKARSWILENVSREVLFNNKAKEQYLYNAVIKDTKKALSNFGYSDEQITDMLVKHYYSVDKSKRNKSLLWIVYGDIILRNLKRNLMCVEHNSKFVKCSDCGKSFEVSKWAYNVCRCPECYKKYRQEYFKLRRKIKNKEQ